MVRRGFDAGGRPRCDQDESRVDHPSQMDDRPLAGSLHDEPAPRRATAISAVSRFSTTCGNRGQSGVPDSSRPGQPPHDPVGFPLLAPRPAPPSGPTSVPKAGPLGVRGRVRTTTPARPGSCTAAASSDAERSRDGRAIGAPAGVATLERVRRAQPARAGQTRPRLSHRLATASGNQCARVVTRSGMDLARPLRPEDGSGDSRRTNPYGDAWSAGAAGWPERPRPDSTARWTRDRPPASKALRRCRWPYVPDCRSAGRKG
jgi:hypothetical protein